MANTHQRSPLFIIFTTVLIDLIGFGMVIPLISLYGHHYGAEGFELSVLGGIYSMMQFIFAPFWGRLSDRVGRRPILLLSLGGSTLSYLIFALAPNLAWLLIARAFGGIFAANISTAQAYIADITKPSERAKGMGMIGAAFGIGFTLGPPLGGIASAKLGLAAPGLIAASICGLNLFAAYFRLPESLSPSFLAKNLSTGEPAPVRRSRFGTSIKDLLLQPNQRQLGFLMLTFFLVTFAFSTMEQTFSLLFQTKFNLETGDAGLKTGLVLMTSGIVGALIQGGLIRKLVPRFGERKLLLTGLLFNAFAMAVFPYGTSYIAYFFITFPLAVGSALINPSIASLISQSSNAREQGATLGLSQGLGSLARATGPFCGLLTFGIQPAIPFWIAFGITFILFIVCLQVLSPPSDPEGFLSSPRIPITKERLI